MKKNYELVNDIRLVHRTPVIVRIDGVGFSKYTKNLHKPFDSTLCEAMQHTAMDLLMLIPTCKFAYTQSDEISLLLIDYDNIKTDAWYGNSVRKLTSVIASLATREFNQSFQLIRARESQFWPGGAIFDARVFNIPEAEVANYFIWRQRDAIRNSIQACGHTLYTQKELEHKNTDEIKKMCAAKHLYWDDIPISNQRGVAAYKDGTNGYISDKNIPLFTENREYIEKYIPKQ
jgi:tRNA(His) 5'-end guanylyltransferase